jgi:pimeloyl-ACP methyl ester carboxylesterase
VTEPLSHRVPLDTGLSYHVLEWGADEPSLDHTVILVHGFLDIAWGWAPTVAAGLAGRYHVVAPDMRGHGDSDRVGAGGYYHFFDYLADLHSLIDSLGRDRVSLVGHSMGGSITSYYAGTFPARVHRLVMMEGTGPPEMSDIGPAPVKHWLASWKRARDRGAQSTYATVEDAAERLRKTDPRLDPELALFIADKGTAATDDGRRRFKHDPLHLTRGPYPFKVAHAERFWRAITCPVLLVEGGESMFRHGAEEKARRHACFADHRFEVIEGAAHMIQRHQPAALAKLLLEFLG